MVILNKENRTVWIQLIHGKLQLNNNVELGKGNGIGIEKLDELRSEAWRMIRS